GGIPLVRRRVQGELPFPLASQLQRQRAVQLRRDAGGCQPLIQSRAVGEGRALAVRIERSDGHRPRRELVVLLWFPTLDTHRSSSSFRGSTPERIIAAK